MFDSHCHLTDGRFDGDRAAVLVRARQAGVSGVVTIASDVDDAIAARALAEANDEVWHTAGVHPHESGSADEGDLERLRAILSSSPKAVAVGECGLDYHYENSPRDVQRRWFSAQLELASELGKPAVVHSRDAEADTLLCLRDAPPGTSFVLHCFSSGAELLDGGLALDGYVSFSGMITFRKFDGADLVRAVPRDRLLAETDAPYLAPVPHRGKRNEPAYVGRVVESLAEIRGEDAAEVREYTTENALRFYGLA